MTFNPVPKVKYKRRKPTRKQRGQFDQKTRDAIVNRDEGLCRVCKKPGEQIHHCRFKSQGGRGVYTNGLLVCQSCHSDIHMDNNKARFWQRVFEKYYGPDYFRDRWDLRGR